MTVYTHQHDEDEPTQRFGERKWRDVPFLILFILHLGAVVAVLVLASQQKGSDDESDSPVDTGDNAFWIYVAVVSCALFISVVVGLLYIRFLNRFAYFMIYASFIVSVIILLFGASVAFGEQKWGFGAAFVVIAILTIIYYWLIRKNIAFAVVLLNAASDVIKEYPATLYICFLVTLLQVPWFILWGVAVWFSLEYVDSEQVAPYMIYLILSFHWTHEVSKNIVHVTVSGLFATWYFVPAEELPHNPTLRAFRNASTYSLGSICFGSLLISIVKTLRDIIRYLRGEEGDNCAKRCLDCCLSCLGWVIDYFNSYTLTQCAIYGKSFCQAARATSSLFKNTGIEIMVNDSIITSLMFMGSICIGLLGGLIGGFVAIGSGEDWAVNATVAAVSGYIICALTTEVVESGISAIFVCYAEHPEQLQKIHPQLYHDITEKYPAKPPQSHA